MDLIIIGKYIVPFENTTWKMQWNTTERKRQKGTLEWQERECEYENKEKDSFAQSTFDLLSFIFACWFFFIYSVFLCKVIWWKSTKRATKHISKCISTCALRLQILLQNLNEIIWFLNTHKGILCEMYKSKYNYHY